MNKVLEFLKGKKTYVTSVIMGVAAGLKVFGHDIPPGVFEVLAALGLITLRAGVSKAAK